MDISAPDTAALPLDLIVETTSPDPAPDGGGPVTDDALDLTARASVPDDDTPTDEASTAAASTLQAKRRSLEGRKQTYQQQINDLARQRGEMQRAMEAEQRQYAAWRQHVQAEAAPPEAAPSAPPLDPDAPVEDQFETYGQYVQATSQYHAQRAVQYATEQAQQQARAHGRQRYTAHIDQQHQQRLQDYGQRHPQFAEVVNREDIILSLPMVDVIKQSNKGPELMEYLARHTDEAEQVAREQNPLVAYGHMKVLEERVSVASRGVSMAPQHRSQAQPPITPVGSAPSSGMPDPSSLAFGPEYIQRMNAMERQKRRWR